MNETKAKFKVGDKVTAVALPNGFPASRPAVHGLTVASVKHIKSDSIADYYRVLAYADNHASIEGAERFFEHE